MTEPHLSPGSPRLRPLGKRNGQTLAEYSLILAFVSIIAISVMLNLTGNVKSAFTTVDQQVAIAGNGGPLPTPPPRGG